MANRESDLNMNSIDMMKVQESYLKMLKKASIADKFKLKCWMDYCKKNTPISYESFLKTQTVHKFLDKLHYGIVSVDDIATIEEIESAIVDSYQ